MGRILLLIAGIVVALAVAGSSPPKQGAREEQRQAQEPLRQAAQTASTPQAPDPEPLNATCDKGEQDRKSDLCAQWYAADAAKMSAVWTRWTGVFTGFGLFVGAITMGAAIFAAIFAKKAADHTREAVEAADLSNRAWIVHELKITSLRFSGDQVTIEGSATLENIGTTPANYAFKSFGQLYLGGGYKKRVEGFVAEMEAAETDCPLMPKELHECPLLCVYDIPPGSKVEGQGILPYLTLVTAYSTLSTRGMTAETYRIFHAASGSEMGVGEYFKQKDRGYPGSQIGFSRIGNAGLVK